MCVASSAKGLAPKEWYQVYLAESNQSPFGKLQPSGGFESKIRTVRESFKLSDR
jgi:hypothetical protein